MRRTPRSVMGRKTHQLALIAAVAVVVVVLQASRPVLGAPPLGRDDFVQFAQQGFGDRHNSLAWSMQWWKGHLYVGTAHAFYCANQAAFNYNFPTLFPYPPQDPDVECTARPDDLPLQAEIWRWTPSSNTWARVYQSPNDVRLPNGKFIARDVGYRGMSVFREPDGTEALYVSAVSARFMGYSTPPPRLLRSTDGITFTPVPQDPGTVLGDLEYTGFRGQTSYKGRFYIQAGNVGGPGVLLEAQNPAAGNNNFRVVTPHDTLMFEMLPYNGYLYVGFDDLQNGFTLAKTDATGEPPYKFTTVIDKGGYLLPDANQEVAHMIVFRDRLYVGGNGVPLPADLYRVNPDDSWDLLVGTPRDTPSGRKIPLSGFDTGFCSPFNRHMWRMAVHDDNLYVGTYDSSTNQKDKPNPPPEEGMGFDLYRTSNGVDFVPITTNGFGDKFNFGARTLESTPHGLIVGTANWWYGLQMWRGGLSTSSGKPIYLPLVAGGQSGPRSQVALRVDAAACTTFTTPTVTSTATSTTTHTPTMAPTNTPTVADTATVTPTLTATETETPTFTPTATEELPISTPTTTETVIPPETPTSTPTDTEPTNVTTVEGMRANNS